MGEQEAAATCGASLRISRSDGDWKGNPGQGTEGILSGDRWRERRVSRMNRVTERLQYREPAAVASGIRDRQSPGRDDHRVDHQWLGALALDPPALRDRCEPGDDRTGNEARTTARGQCEQ